MRPHSNGSSLCYGGIIDHTSLPFFLLIHKLTAFQAGPVIKKSLSPNMAKIIKAILTFNESVVSSKVLVQLMISLESSNTALLENVKEVHSLKSPFSSFTYHNLQLLESGLAVSSKHSNCLNSWMLEAASHNHILTTQTWTPLYLPLLSYPPSWCCLRLLSSMALQLMPARTPR